MNPPFSLVLVVCCGNYCFLVPRLVAILVGIWGALWTGQTIPFNERRGRGGRAAGCGGVRGEAYGAEAY